MSRLRKDMAALDRATRAIGNPATPEELGLARWTVHYMVGDEQISPSRSIVAANRAQAIRKHQRLYGDPTSNDPSFRMVVEREGGAARRNLACDMVRGCPGAITHVDEKGYLYCAPHGQQRKASGVRARQLSPAEIKTLAEGGVISYSRARRNPATFTSEFARRLRWEPVYMKCGHWEPRLMRHQGEDPPRAGLACAKCDPAMGAQRRVQGVFDDYQAAQDACGALNARDGR